MTNQTHFCLFYIGNRTWGFKPFLQQFLRINKSYIVNTSRIDSFDTNDIFIKSYEIGIGGGNYKKTFFEEFVAKNLQKD